jgi:hypothetical protein
MVEKKNACYILVRKPEEKDRSEDLVIHGRIILKWILKTQGVKLWTGFSCFRIGSS